MKALHRVLVLGIPLVLLVASAFFYQRAGRIEGTAQAELSELMRASQSAVGAARERLQVRIEAAEEREQEAISQRGFWTMALAFAAFFVLLGGTFVVLERRHQRQSEALIASFEDELGPPGGGQ